MAYHIKIKQSFFYQLISSFVLISFLFTSIVPPTYAQSLNLPPVGVMVNPTPAFVPVLLKGMTVYPDNPLRFDFIVDSGNTKFTPDQIKEESNRLVKYFLAAMTVPQNDLWVNLSPYEADKIIPDALGKTELGRDMLAQDYILKQLSATLLYPEKELGKNFWDKVYKKAQERFGTREIPINTFNKVWIIPDEATVYENGNAVYIVKSRLKVMLDEDYVAMANQQAIEESRAPARGQAMQENQENAKLGTDQLSDSQLKDSASLSSHVVREIILPEIEREVNEGQNFAPIRQIYQSLILAKWYKETIKESLPSKVYIDQKKIKGVDLSDPTVKDQIYARYVEAFKKGVFDFIKEDYDQLSQEVIPRKYFSGGEKFGEIPLKRTNDPAQLNPSPVGDDYKLALRIEPHSNTSDKAMSSEVSWQNLQDEGYSVGIKRSSREGEEVLDVELQRNDIKVFSSKITINVYPKLKIIYIQDFYPNFPDKTMEEYKVGRGRALLRHLLEDSGDYQGYRIIGIAEPSFIKSFQQMKEYGPEVAEIGSIYDQGWGPGIFELMHEFKRWITYVGHGFMDEDAKDLNQMPYSSELTHIEWTILNSFLSRSNIFGVVPRKETKDTELPINSNSVPVEQNLGHKDIINDSDDKAMLSKDARIPVILLTGMPGSGKGTVGPVLAAKLGVPHISLGEILRKMWDVDPSFPRTDDLGAQRLVALLKAESVKYANGFVLDSNPVSIESQKQVEDALEKENFSIVKVVNISIDQEIAKARFVARPRSEDIERHGSTAARFDHRLKQHNAVTAPLVNRFAEKGQVILLENNGTLEDMKRTIDEIVPELNLMRIMAGVKGVGWKESEVRDVYIPLVKELIRTKDANASGRLTVGISGLGGSGKTTLADLLNVIARTLQGQQYSSILSQDDFFMTTEDLQESKVREWTPEAVNIDEVAKQLDAFKKGEAISLPILKKIQEGSQSQDFKRSGSRSSQPEGILFVEGIDILNRNLPQHENLYRKLDITIYVSADLADVKTAWIEREGRKYPERPAIEHERKWEERVNAERKSPGSLTIAEREGLWVNADIIIEKSKNQGLKAVYQRSPFAKGRSLTRINEVTINPMSGVEKTIEGLIARISSLGVDEREKSLKVINKLKEVYRNLGIGWIDVLARNDNDYVIGFSDQQRQQIGLAPEFFKTDGLFADDLEKAIFYLGYQLAFPNAYQSVDQDYMQLHRSLFGSDEVVRNEKVRGFVTIASRPKGVLFSPMNADQMQRLDISEGKGSLNLAKQIAERIRQDNQGKMPTVAFLTPTGKGGGVSVLVKDIAEVLFSNEVGIQGKWISTVRHENIDYWGASGRFQQNLMGTSDGINAGDLERLKKAMIDNVEGMDLEGVDYIFMHEPYTLGMIPVIREKYPNIKIIWFNHGDLSPAKPVGRQMMREYLSDANAAIFSWMKEYIPKGDVGAPTVFMIHGINQENAKNILLPDNYINAVAQKYGIDRSRPVLLHVGRYNLTKDPLRSISIYLALKKMMVEDGAKNKLPQLVLSGIPLAPSDWKLYGKLQEFIKFLNDPDIHMIAADNVATEYTAEQIKALEDAGLNADQLDSWDRSDLELNALQRLASVGVHPAMNEGFGLVISEALIKGTPVVASNIGGIPMQITNREFLVDLPIDPFEGMKDRYKQLGSGDYDGLKAWMATDQYAKTFSEKVNVVLNMKASERGVFLKESLKHIAPNYSILRSMIGHLKLIEVIGLIERIRKNNADSDAFERLSKVDKEFIPVIVRQFRDSDPGTQDRLLEVLKRIGDETLESIQGDIEYLKKDQGDDFDTFYKKMKEIVKTYPKDYVPLFIRELNQKDIRIQRNYVTLLTIMGEEILPDLIRSFERPSIGPYMKQGIIKVLRDIFSMGNNDIRELFKNYLRNKGASTAEGDLHRSGLSYDEVLGKLAETVASFSNIARGEEIAIGLINKGIYPTETIVSKIASGESDAEGVANRLQAIRRDGNFDKSNPIDRSLGYSLLRSDAETQGLKFDFTYDDYLLWIDGGKDYPIFGGAPNIEQKHSDELYYLALEAKNLETEIVKAAERARAVNRPFMVIGNNTYGGQVALAPIVDSLRNKNIAVSYLRVPSGNVHLNPYYIPYDILDEKDLKYILEKQPVVFIVDGTNSLRGTVLEGLKRRFRTPHYPDAYVGFRNYFLALNETLGIRTNYEDFSIPEQTYQNLRQTPQYGRLVNSLKALLSGSKQEGRRETYKFNFWSASKVRLPIRLERELVGLPPQRNVDDISGPEVIFAQSVSERRDEGFSTHVPGYFDISLFESGYRNFDYVLSVDDSGPRLKSIRATNIELSRRYLSVIGEKDLARRTDGVEAIILDLDGTLAEYKQGIPDQIIKQLIAIITSNKKVVIITEDLEANVDQRIRSLVEAIPETYRNNVIVYSDGGTNGYYFDTDGEKVPLAEYNKLSLIGGDLRGRIESIVVNKFSGLISFDDRDSRVSPRLRIDLRVAEGDASNNLIDNIRHELSPLGEDVKVYKAGRSSIKIVRQHKEHAARNFIKNYKIEEGAVMVIADSARENEVDKDLLSAFPQAVNVNVGRYSESLARDNPSAIQNKEGGSGVNTTHEMLAGFASTNILNNMRLIHQFIEMPTETHDYYATNVHVQYRTQERAIVAEEARLKVLYDIAARQLIDAARKQDLKKIEELRSDSRAVLEELKVVLKAREKFIRFGVPAYHAHTNLNDDGKLTPEQLVEHAIKNGITVLYVTGHDRIDGSRVAVEFAKKQDYILDMRPAVEIDAPFLGAGAITHMVVVAPNDEDVIKRLGEIGADVFQRMQINLGWRFEKAVDFGSNNGEAFEEAWRNVFVKGKEDGLRKIASDLYGALRQERANDLFEEEQLENDMLQYFKIQLKQWFNDVYENKHLKLVEFYNKLDVLGNWTEGIEAWKSKHTSRSASYIRRAMRQFFNLVYSDQDVENAVIDQFGQNSDKVIMRRAEDVAKEVSELGCRVVLAHVGFELFVINEITDKNAFTEKIIEMVKSRHLHAIGAGWSREDERKVKEEIINPVRQVTNTTAETLPTVYNIPDYHGHGFPQDKSENIAKGILHKGQNDEGKKIEYWTWEDSANPPDIENYFRDGQSLARPILDGIRRSINGGDYRTALNKIKIAYETHRYSEELMNLMEDLIKQNTNVLEGVGGVSPGGIDMNNINVNRQGSGIDIQFDPAMMQDILNNGVDGFVPVIINLTPINSIFPILGLKEPMDKEDAYYEMSSLN